MAQGQGHLTKPLCAIHDCMPMIRPYLTPWIQRGHGIQCQCLNDADSLIACLSAFHLPDRYAHDDRKLLLCGVAMIAAASFGDTKLAAGFIPNIAFGAFVGWICWRGFHGGAILALCRSRKCRNCTSSQAKRGVPCLSVVAYLGTCSGSVSYVLNHRETVFCRFKAFLGGSGQLWRQGVSAPASGVSLVALCGRTKVQRVQLETKILLPALARVARAGLRSRPRTRCA